MNLRVLIIFFFEWSLLFLVFCLEACLHFTMISFIFLIFHSYVALLSNLPLDSIHNIVSARALTELKVLLRTGIANGKIEWSVSLLFIFFHRFLIYWIFSKGVLWDFRSRVRMVQLFESSAYRDLISGYLMIYSLDRTIIFMI